MRDLSIKPLFFFPQAFHLLYIQIRKRTTPSPSLAISPAILQQVHLLLGLVLYVVAILVE